MRDERLEVSVTFDERGYIGSAPELRQPVTALSLGGLRRRIECCLTTSTSCCSLTASPSANGTAAERRQRSRIAQLDQRTLSRTNVRTWRKRTCGPQGGSPGLMWWTAPAPSNEVP
jgi:hypothetical protein